MTHRFGRNLRDAVLQLEIGQRIGAVDSSDRPAVFFPLKIFLAHPFSESIVILTASLVLNLMGLAGLILPWTCTVALSTSYSVLKLERIMPICQSSLDIVQNTLLVTIVWRVSD